MDYSPALRALALVLADGRCALCRAADGGLAPVEQLAFAHWVCNAGSGAQCVRIGAPPASMHMVFNAQHHLSPKVRTLGEEKD